MSIPINFLDLRNSLYEFKFLNNEDFQSYLKIIKARDTVSGKAVDCILVIIIHH